MTREIDNFLFPSKLFVARFQNPALLKIFEGYRSGKQANKLREKPNQLS